jgi:hypothetical protein
LVRKAKQAGDPFGGREPSCLERKTLRPGQVCLERGRQDKGERGKDRERDSVQRLGSGKAWEVRNPKRAGATDPE